MEVYERTRSQTLGWWLLASALGAGWIMSDDASAQRTSPVATCAVDAPVPAGGTVTDVLSDGSVADASEPLAYELDENGRPIYGRDIPIEDPSGTALASFHAALRRAERGDGQARLVFYGASHVAADMFTGTIRRLLQERFGDAGHGFVLPVEPWRHYRHTDLDIESNFRRWDVLRVHVGQTAPSLYGIMGVALTTDAAHAYGRIDTGQASASRFELWYSQRPDGGTIDLLVDGHVERRLSTRSAELNPGYAVVSTADCPHTFEIRVRGDGPVTLYGATVERERPGVIVDEMGINGARAASQLLWDEPLQVEQLRRRMPDLVVLAYGTNESGDDTQPIETYERELRQVVTRVQTAVPTSSCLLVGPSDRPIVHRDGTYEPRPRTQQVIDTQRRVALDYGCGFFDMVAFGGGPFHMMEWADAEPAWAQRDHVHYTVRGYTRLGEVIANALVDRYDVGAPIVTTSVTSTAAPTATR